MTKPNIPESTAPEKPEDTGEPTNPQKPEGPTTSGEGKPNFKDIKANCWYSDAVIRLVEMGVLQGRRYLKCFALHYRITQNQNNTMVY